MDTEDRLVELETNFLQPNPLQPRGLISPDSLTDLVNSIREQGILEPIVVAKTPAGFQIIAGERRWRAARVLGLSKVPVVIRETTPQGMLEMSIVENVQREDLNPIERAQAYKRLIDEFGISVTEVAKRVGKSLPYISNSIRLLTLPDAIKDALAAGVITEGHVRPLISINDHKLMLSAFKKILVEGISVRGAEEVARQIKAETQKREPHKKADKIYIPEQEDMAKKIKEKLACHNVELFQSSKEGRIRFVWKGNEEETGQKLKEIYDKIMDASL
ncbi:ParB/RepB/Spo0J family partition protein [Candidatus Parcubacteria bacterium]|nr:MAG: ParB/RepB/Spo0J family partition protein [Candidatus Parcubacteria bacterium]